MNKKSQNKIESVNFGSLPGKYSSYDTAAVVIVPAPYDRTSTWMKGADKGPQAIIQASANMELYDIETDFQVYKKGIFTDKALHIDLPPEEMTDLVTEKINRLLEDSKFPVLLGGEHSVSIGAVKAHAQNTENLTVLQLDAHADLRDEYDGSKFNHACVMARVKQFCPIVQVGIRSMDASEKDSIDPERTFFAKDIIDNLHWINNVISLLSQNVYVTFDLDVFDPSIMPSTGTPEPGGLDFYTVLALLKAVADSKNIVGFDVVELCPNDLNKAPDFLTAKLIYKFLSYKFR
jgi:agmatinase